MKKPVRVLVDEDEDDFEGGRWEQIDCRWWGTDGSIELDEGRNSRDESGAKFRWFSDDEETTSADWPPKIGWQWHEETCKMKRSSTNNMLAWEAIFTLGQKLVVMGFRGTSDCHETQQLERLCSARCCILGFLLIDKHRHCTAVRVLLNHENRKLWFLGFKFYRRLLLVYGVISKDLILLREGRLCAI